MNKLESLLKYVAKNNKYYKDVINQNNISDPNDITMYPILTRKKLQENRHAIFSDGYEKLYYSQQLITQSSSGTTGVPIYTYWETKDYYNSMRILWRKRLEYYGVHPYQKHIQFTLNSVSSEKYDDKVVWIKESQNILNICRSSLREEKNYKQLIKIIEEFEPEWLYIQPYILRKLIKSYIDNNIKPPSSILYVESVGEILPLELKELAKSFFKVPVANLYGSEEMNGIAYECPFNRMHVLSENVYVECRNVNGIHCIGEGEAIITNLANKAMPLIRYNQGDLITLNNLPKPCSCGSIEPVVDRIIGREYEKIKVGKVELNPYMLLMTMSNINNEFNSMLTCYRFEYSKANKSLVCFIELSGSRKKWFKVLKDEILSMLTPILECSAGITIDVLHDIQDNNFDNKHKFFKIAD